MATTKQSRKQSHNALVRQVARSLTISYAVVHVATNRLVGIRANRRLARDFVREKIRAGAARRSLAVRRIDLRVKGLSA